MSSFFLIAEIKTVTLDDGFISLFLHSDFPDRFGKLKEVYIDVFGEKRKFIVEKAITKKNSIFIKLLNFDNEEDVSFLYGKKIYIDSKDQVKLSENEFFVHELIDSEVYQTSIFIGTIKDVMKLPCHDVYVIKRKNKNDCLIPAVKDFILKYDREKRMLILKDGIDFSIYDEN